MDAYSKFIDIKNYEIHYSMFSLPILEGDNIVEVSKNQNKAFMKVNFFIKSILDCSIVYTIDDSVRMKTIFGEAENNFVTIPDFTETTLLEAIHSKLSVLCGNSTFIDQISIRDLDTKVGYDLMPDPEPEYTLPDVSEWISELSFYELPWWRRYDSSTFDDVAADRKELKKFRKTIIVGGDVDLAIIDGEIDDIFNEDDSDDAVKIKGVVIDLEEARKSPKKGKWEPKIV